LGITNLDGRQSTGLGSGNQRAREEPSLDEREFSLLLLMMTRKMPKHARLVDRPEGSAGGRAQGALSVRRLTWMTSLATILDELRNQLIDHRLGPRKYLWSTIVKQLAKQHAFDGAHADIIEKTIRDILRPLDHATLFELWRDTELGMNDDDDADCHLTDCLRADLEVEMLEQIVEQASYEATGRIPPRARNEDDGD
jgi:hypothetical protein